MKIYIHIASGQYPMFEQDIKQMFPLVSFSSPFIAPEGFAEVIATKRPPVLPLQTVIEQAPVHVNGAWQQSWRIEDVDEQTAQIRTAKQLASIRTIRNKRLQESDWIVSISDSPFSPEKTAEWVEYRQALRDITDAADPFDIKWPKEPSA